MGSEMCIRDRNEFVAQFIGSPSMNILGGTITATGEQTVVKLDSGGIATSTVPSTAADQGKRVNVGVRPEDFVLVEATADSPAVFSGRVSITEALGEVTLLYLSTDDGQMIAKLPGIHQGLRNKAVSLDANPEKVHVFLEGQSLLYRGA